MANRKNWINRSINLGYSRGYSRSDRNLENIFGINTVKRRFWLIIGVGHKIHGDYSITGLFIRRSVKRVGVVG